MQQILFIFSVILAGFVTGQVLVRQVPLRSDSIRSICVFIALRITTPIAISLAIWQLNIESWSLAFLPLIGSAFLLTSFAVAWGMSKLLKMPAEQVGVYAPAGGFTNIGAIGALTVFVFLGESGLAILPLFKVFEEVIYYAFFFPFAASQTNSTGVAVRKWWRDPVIKLSLLSVVIGFSLNLLNIERPDEFVIISKFLLPIGTFALMVTVGLAFRIGSVKKQWRLGLLLALVKQLIIPVILVAVLFTLGFAQSYDGMIIKVCFLIACMPMAFVVMLPAAMYKLDQDLANACWFTSTVIYIVMLPFFPFLISQLDRWINL